MSEAIEIRKKLFQSWLALAALLEYYEAAEGTPENVKHRADVIAAFRSVEEAIGVTQSLPRRVR